MSLKGHDLKKGMLVVAMKLTGKAKRRLPDDYPQGTQNQPLEVKHIEYPMVIFEYEGAALKPTGGMFGIKKVGTQAKKYALDVRGVRFKEVTPEYAAALKAGAIVPEEEQSIAGEWDTER